MWEVSLRCPNCEWETTDVYDQDTVERFDEELDRGTDSLVDDLKRLVAANMRAGRDVAALCEAVPRFQVTGPADAGRASAGTGAFPDELLTTMESDQ